MNARQCKKLRRIAERRLIGRPNVMYWEPVATHRKPTYFCCKRKGDKGQQLPRHVGRRLLNDCVRGLYQNLKRGAA